LSDAHLSFPASHPAFAGHFPGAPLVPGALLIAAALEALGLGGAGTVIASAKFLQPVQPDAQVAVRRISATRIELSVAGRPVASAVLREPRE
jgi:3-hydroxymyristoyl/3-hydroxydecanoyl-(acyl carrier protein) dehydratase